MIANHIRRTISTVKALVLRPLHTNNVIYSAQNSPLFKLRQKTGLAYNLCREALNKHDNDVNEAEAWLRAQTLAHGLHQVNKVSARSTREGLVGLAVDQNKKLVTVLELNCETDFVVKNQVFKDFAIDLTEQVASIKEDCAVHQFPDQTSVAELRLTKDQLKIIDDQIVPLITRLGENIKVNRAAHFQVVEDNIQLFAQVHAKAGEKCGTNIKIMTGRFAAIVALATQKVSNLDIIGNRLCLHVIGYSPTQIELPDQTLIMSEEETVKDFCKENEISIVYFNRFECK